MFCSYCGNEINECNKFCPNCGKQNKYFVDSCEKKNNIDAIKEIDSNDKTVVTENQYSFTNENLSYFRKHWQGKLSLAISYWVNNILLTSILVVLITIIIETLNFTDNPTFSATLIILMWLSVLLLTPWILIGLWRSAANHIKKYNKFFWARVVQILVVVGWIQSLTIIVNQAIPQIVEFSKIVLQNDFPNYKIKILNNGNELEIYGGIKFGLTNEIKKYFLQYPNIKVIHLNSLGGRITEAKKISKFLENKYITTYSSRGCYSACVDIFMSGEYRVINQNAQLGFHQPSFPGVTQADMYQEIEKQKTFYRKKGVKDNFIKKAFSTPPEDLWKPSNFELKQAGVIHEIVDGYNFSATDLQAFSDIKKLESTLLSIPVYQTIKTYEPEKFNEIIDIINTSIKNGDTKNNMFAKTRTIAQELYLKYLPYASNESVSNFLDLALKQTKIIYLKNPIEAYNFSMGISKAFNPYTYFSNDLIQKEQKLINDVIISAKSDPHNLPNEKDIEVIQRKIMIPLLVEFGEDLSLLNKMNPTDVEKATVVKVLIRMYEIISKLNYEEKTKYVRYFVNLN